MVDTRFDFGVTRVTPKQFEKQVRIALEHGFAVQTLSDYMNGGPHNKRRTAITFDDGYESVYTYAFPILRHYGLTATVFVNTGYCGKRNTWDVNLGGLTFPHLSWEQIRELDKAGWEIGSHTVNHMDLTCIPPKAARRELSESRRALKKQVTHVSPFVSYPFGNTNAGVIELCKQVGYSGGTVMGLGSEELEPDYAIPRIGVYLLDNKWTFTSKLYGRNMHLFYGIQGFLNKCSNGTVFVKKWSWKF